MLTHLVQIGFAGDCFVASFADPETNVELGRGKTVLVRTPRGIEFGEIISPVADQPHETSLLKILRVITQEDQWLIDRLRQHKVTAVRRCQDALAVSDSQAVLLDVDQLIDGGTLVLHFIGEPDAIGRELTDEIVKLYESEVQSIQLGELIETGCGPGCGTSEASGGCGSEGGCASCGVAAACRT